MRLAVTFAIAGLMAAAAACLAQNAAETDVAAFQRLRA